MEEYILKIHPTSIKNNSNYVLNIGIPFQKGKFFYKEKLQIIDQDKKNYPCDIKPLCYWSDSSIKWALLTVYLISSPNILLLKLIESKSQKEFGINIKEHQDIIKINTKCFEFIINKINPNIFENIPLDINFISKKGKIKQFKDIKQKKVKILSRGRLKTDIEIKGVLSISKKKKLQIRLITSFFYLSSVAKIDVEIHNPSSSSHPGGNWDLGDDGSIFFKDLSIIYNLDVPLNKIKYTLDFSKYNKLTCTTGLGLKLYQDSSGGENWNSKNHINFKQDLTVRFKGFYLKEIDHNNTIKKIEGNRASPLILVKEKKWIACSIKEFWQNFPNTIEVKDSRIRISVFPKECKSLFELQGGEKKRHTVYIDFNSDPDGNNILIFLHPPLYEINPAWIKETKVIPYFLPESEDKNLNYLSYIKNIISGPNSFFKKREQIDEYGWRNFGDIYADHEAVNHNQKEPFISHYNNQYDFLYGAILHFLRSSNSKWIELALPLAQHLIDIDIYHTDMDKSAYNHGMFWHTDHYLQAKTATHRTYSKLNNSQGGGPSNEHNYTSGLLYYYFLTGDYLAKEAVIELAEWVINMDMGAKTLYSIFDQSPTGLATQTVDPLYHGPGRGAGNSINALIDAYILTNNRKYLFKAEEFIRRTIHPNDDIEKLSLDEPEHRWSYLVYLQILDKYLYLKTELNELDWMYFYAQNSLIHYGQWMLENEVPYKDILHKVEIPTETWPAQDIRKAYVLNCVSKYVDPEHREMFLKKAKFFFKRCIQDVLSFETAYLARPMILLCVYGYQQAYFDNIKTNELNSIRKTNYCYGSPTEFIPQRFRWKITLKSNINIFLKELSRIFTNKIKQILS